MARVWRLVSFIDHFIRSLILIILRVWWWWWLRCRLVLLFVLLVSGRVVGRRRSAAERQNRVHGIARVVSPPTVIAATGAVPLQRRRLGDKLLPVQRPQVVGAVGDDKVLGGKVEHRRAVEPHVRRRDYVLAKGEPAEGHVVAQEAVLQEEQDQS